MARPRAETHAAVLLIHAAEEERSALAGVLESEGFQVHEVDSGIAALGLLGRHPFDLIVTEPKLPGFAGAHAVTALREIAPEVPIVVCAVSGSIAEAVQCMKQGAAEYLTPDSAASLLPAVAARAVERRGARTSVEPSVAMVDAAHRADVAARALELWQRAIQGDAHVLSLATANGCEVFPSRDARRLQSGSWPEIMKRVGEPTEPVQPFSAVELRDHGLAGAIVVPLRARRIFVGNAMVLRRSPPAFSAHEVTRMAELGERLGAALHPLLRACDLEERLREVELHRDQMVQTEKLALARKLVGGVAHEINNPLAFVRANLEALRDYAQTAVHLIRGERARPEMSPDELVAEIEAIVCESQEGLRRIGDLIANFQLLSTPHVQARREKVELVELVDACIGTATAAGATDGKKSRRFVRETHERIQATVVKNDLVTGILHVLSYLRDPERTGVEAAEAEPVRLRIAADGGQPCVFVFDPLLEIPAAERASVFDPRLNVEEVRGQRRIRLDLELALAHQLLVRAGGIVSLQPGPNSGLIFRIRLGV